MWPTLYVQDNLPYFVSKSLTIRNAILIFNGRLSGNRERMRTVCTANLTDVESRAGGVYSNTYSVHPHLKHIVFSKKTRVCLKFSRPSVPVSVLASIPMEIIYPPPPNSCAVRWLHSVIVLRTLSTNLWPLMTNLIRRWDDWQYS